MTQPNQDARGSEETQSLHLSKFAHGQAEPKTEFLTKDESPTIMIKRAVKSVAANEELRIVLPRGTTMTPTEMLGALSYCYAKGVYSSEDIEARMLKDAGFREAIKDEVPRPDVLRRFRRLNHAAIIAVLEKYFVAERRKTAGVRAVPPANPPPPATDDSGSTACIAKRKANDRLNQAMFTDNMMRED